MINLKKQIDRYNWIRRMLLSGVHLNCNEIAERLDCSPKTAHRYINAMRRDGYRVEYDAQMRGFKIITQEKPS